MELTCYFHCLKVLYQEYHTNHFMFFAYLLNYRMKQYSLLTACYAQTIIYHTFSQPFKPLFIFFINVESHRKSKPCFKKKNTSVR